MNKKEFNEIEAYMLSQMQDSAHDKHHVYRVLNAAIDIYIEMKARLILIYWLRHACCMILDERSSLLT